MPKIEKHSEVIKATLIGILAVFIWGPALPIVRMVSERIGPVGYLGITMFIPAVLGIAKNALLKEPHLTKQNFKTPIFYARCACFFINYAFTTSSGKFSQQTKFTVDNFIKLHVAHNGDCLFCVFSGGTHYTTLGFHTWIIGCALQLSVGISRPGNLRDAPHLSANGHHGNLYDSDRGCRVGII